MKSSWISTGTIIIPSNSYIYLYGNMDMAEKLTLDGQRHYLSRFTMLLAGGFRHCTAEAALLTSSGRMVRSTIPSPRERTKKENTYLS